MSAGDDFCEACGRRQTPPCTVCGGLLISADGYCETCGVRQPTGRDHQEIETGAGAVGAVSDRGLRHSRNEDAMAVSLYSKGILAVVSDGVSSSNHPEDASQAAVDAAATMLTECLEAGADPETATRTAIEHAALAVARLDDESSNPPACTYVSAVVGPEAVTIGWVGDSRAYWLAAAEDDTTGFFSSPERVSGNGSGVLDSAILTVDDSLGGLEFTSHLLTSWLGADAGDLEPHVETYRPGGPGLLLVCSDGLWNYFPQPAELEAVSRTANGTPLSIARALVQSANAAGGHDNITVVVIPFPPSSQAAAPESAASGSI
ncbi:PP2C family protein-serine/threonine phosphatase [Flindersiella endophytica]